MSPMEESVANGKSLRIVFAASALVLVVLCYVLVSRNSADGALIQHMQNVCLLWGCGTIEEPVKHAPSQLLRSVSIHVHSPARVQIQPARPKRIQKDAKKVTNPKSSSHLTKQATPLIHPGSARTQIVTPEALKDLLSVEFHHDEAEIAAQKEIIKQQATLIAQQAAELRLILNHGKNGFDESQRAFSHQGPATAAAGAKQRLVSQLHLPCTKVALLNDHGDYARTRKLVSLSLRLRLPLQLPLSLQLCPPPLPLSDSFEYFLLP